MLSDTTRTFMALHETRADGAGPAFEAMLRKAYETVLKDGDTAFDCGANWGMHTIPMAVACGARGRVHAFEPIAAAIRGVAEQLEKHGLSRRVELHQIALSNENRTVEFRHVSRDPALSSLRPTRHHDNKEVTIEKVETRRLDDYYRGDPPRFMKMDVEGAEYHVLCGAKNLIRAARPIIIFENGRQESASNFGYTKSEFFDVFRAIDYRLHFITGDVFEESDWPIHPTPWYYLATPRGCPETPSLTSMLAEETRKLVQS